METILIQIRNDKAYMLLKDLESLHIIKIFRREEQPTQNLSEKYSGKLSGEVAEKLQSYIAESRREWNNKYEPNPISIYSIRRKSQ